MWTTWPSRARAKPVAFRESSTGPYLAALAYLGDDHRLLLQGLLQGEVVRLAGLGGQEREKDQVPVGLDLGQLDNFQESLIGSIVMPPSV